MGEVYFIHARRVELVKIGYTQGNAANRVTNLQTASPVELTLFGAIAGTRRDERALHGFFADARVRGEWFSDKILPEVTALIRKRRTPTRVEPVTHMKWEHGTSRAIGRNDEIARLSDAGWTQATLAMRFGLSQSAISKVITKARAKRASEALATVEVG